MEGTQLTRPFNVTQLRIEVWKRELKSHGFDNVEIYETVDGVMAVLFKDLGVTVSRIVRNEDKDGLLNWLLDFFKEVKLRDPDYKQAVKFKEVMQWACK